MVLKICSLCSLLLLLGSMDAQAQIFPQVRANFEQGRVFEADFEHVYIDSYTKESLSSTGKIWVSSDKYRLESEGQLLIVDGETSKVYDQAKNRVIISEYSEDEDDFAPSRMLKGVDSTYVIDEIRQENGQVKIIMETEDDFALYVKVEILVDAKAQPLSITAYDFSDNVIITTFKNGKFVDKKENLFVLKHPENAEIVDTRY